VRVYVHDAGEARGSALSVADLDALAPARAFRHFGAYSMLAPSFALDSAAGAEPVTGTAATSGVFGALRVAPVVGRVFVAADDQAGAQRVALLGHELWSRRFGRTPEAVGQVLTIDGAPHTVVGVMPPGFRIPGRADEQLWVNLPLEPPSYRAPFFLQGLGRLAKGGAGPRVDAELARIEAAVKQRWPESSQAWEAFAPLARDPGPGRAGDAADAVRGGRPRPPAHACANVANLLLAARASTAEGATVLGARPAARAWPRNSRGEAALVAASAPRPVSACRARRARVPRPDAENAWAVEQGVLDARVLVFTASIAVLSGLAVGSCRRCACPRPGRSPSRRRPRIGRGRAGACAARWSWASSPSRSPC
jgi:hypothetical protein